MANRPKLSREALSAYRQLELAGLVGPLPKEEKPEPRVDKISPVADTSARQMPVCARCGGPPSLGVCRGEGVVSMCRKCADEEYLEMLTPEDRALLRRP